ncbi:MAG: hypothetical protein H6978_07210 [Gammaproteobacteria bacterium]|nr:hypothetical protein [Gammaproteobacteria bacterium]
MDCRPANACITFIARLAGCLLLPLAWASIASAQSNISVSLDPGLPGETTAIAALVSYDLPTACYTLTPSHSVSGNTVTIDIDQQASGGICSFVVTRFDIARDIGVLPVGHYQLVVRINGQTYAEQPFDVVTTAPFGLLDPADGSEACALAVFDWDDAAVDQPEYELLIASDPQFQSIAISQSHLVSSRAVVDTFSTTENQHFWWTVTVRDANQVVRYSEEVREIILNPTGHCAFGFGTGVDSVIVGLVQSELDAVLIAGATVTVAQQGRVVQQADITDRTGQFILHIEQFDLGQTIEISISRPGFDTTVINVTLSSRSVIEVHTVPLTESVPVGGIGDPDPEAALKLLPILNGILNDD